MAFFRKRTKHPLIRIFLLLVVVGAVAFLYFDNLKKVSAEWFDSSWFYRKAIEIPSHTASENNVYVTVPAFDATDTTRFQSDCGDLRFTKKNGQLLSYYVVDCDATADIHVQFDTLPAGASTYYMYYGNPSAPNGFESADFSTAASGLGSQTLSSEEKGPAPVAYWKFDEGQGQTAYDDSTNNNDGTLGSAAGSDTNDPTWKTGDQCVFGKCLKFDGTDNYVDAGGSNTIDSITGDLTLETWIYINESKDAEVISTRYGLNDFTRPYSIFIASSSNQASLRLGNGVAQFTNASTGNLNLNTWYHVVGTISGNNIVMYLNGIQVGTDTFSGSRQTGTKVTIGSAALGTTRNFNGFIDDVKIYPYARTAAQIKADYNSRGSLQGVALRSQNDLSYLSNGLVGYWKMDDSGIDAEGETSTDSSGAGNTGTLYGDNGAGDNGTGLDCTATGKFGSSCQFDGVDDYVDVGNGSSLDITGNIAVSAWLYYTVDPTTFNGMIVNKGSTSGTTDQTYYLYNRSVDSKLYFDIVNSSQTEAVATYPLSASWLNQWVHVVGTYDGSKVRIYVNGVEGTSGNQTGAIQSKASTNLFIGRRSSDTTLPFTGKIDDLRIYNRALSPKEVADLYNFAPGPLRYWPMDDGVSGNSQTLADKSGNGGNATTYWGSNAAGMNCTVPGRYGKACSFDGVDDYALFTAASLGTVYTLEAWVYPGADTSSDWFNILSNNGSPQWGMPDGALTHQLYGRVTGSAITRNQWTHVTVTRNGNTHTTYKNGVYDAQASVAAGSDTYSVIGAYSYAAAGIGDREPWNGKLDEIKLYNYVRTQKQILEDMNAGHPSVGSPVGSYAAWWKMDEGQGNTLNDQSVNANTGTNNGATWTNDGKFGKALSFDGTASYTDMGNNSSLDPGTGEFSVFAWARCNNGSESSSDRRIITKEKSTSQWQGYTLTLMQTNGNLAGYIRDDSGNTVNTQDSVNHCDGRWHQYGLTVVPLSTTGAKIWVDGVNTATGNLSTVTGTLSTTANMFIGKFRDSSGYWSGSIDEVKIYPFALTADEIKTEYNRGSALQMGSLSDTSGLTGGSVASNSASAEFCIPGDTATCTAPVGYWNFNEKVSGASQTLYDTSGNGNNGTTYSANGTGMNCKVLGKYATGCNFDGVDDYVNLPNLTSVGNDFTLEMWVKAVNFSWHMPFSADQGNNDLGIFLISATDIAFRTSSASTFHDLDCTTVTGVSANQWFHLVVTRNSSGDKKIYVNGVIPSGCTATSAVWNTSITNARLGAREDLSATYWHNGIIDDVKIYNYARTPAQVAWDYNRGKPVAHWKLDECQGSSANDSSGNSSTGTITIGATGSQTAIGTCTTPTDGTGAWYNGLSGKFNSSMSFDGTDDYVSLGTSSNFDPASAMTAEFWIKPTSVTGEQTPLSGKPSWNGSPNDKGYFFYSNNGSLTFRLANGAGAFAVSPTVTIAAGNWYHIVGTWDGSKIRIYSNGTLVGTYTDAVGHTQGSAGTVSYIGAYSTGYYRFNGLIDDAKIYNYALTLQQIKMDYNQGAAVRFGPTSGRP